MSTVPDSGTTPFNRSVPRDARIGSVRPRLLHTGSPLLPLSHELDPFASPEAFDPGLQDFLHQASDLLCHWLAGASGRPPLPSVRRQPDIAPGPIGADSRQLLTDLQQVMEGAFQPSHPGALAHLDPPPLTASIAAELICAGLNNNLLAEELSPGLSDLERQLCRWFALRLGLPDSGGGVLASGGTLSNLMGLLVARDRLPEQQRQEGVVICSADAHVSLLKATRVMGLRGDGLQRLPVDDNGCMAPEALEQALRDLQEQGRSCIAVVATAGTTVRGAVDPLTAMAAICRGHNVWLHVDAAIGGVFALAGTTTALMDGIALADSITLNPQKLLGITKASSLLLLRDPSLLRATFSTGLPYMDTAVGDHHGGEAGLQGTRPAEILKLWLGLRQLGEAGIEQLLQAALDRRNSVCRRLDAERLDVLSGTLHLLAFRPRGIHGSEADLWCETTRRALVQQGFMLSRPHHGQGRCLKAVFGNPHTSEEHLARLSTLINASVDR